MHQQNKLLKTAETNFDKILVLNLILKCYLLNQLHYSLQSARSLLVFEVKDMTDFNRPIEVNLLSFNKTMLCQIILL